MGGHLVALHGSLEVADAVVGLPQVIVRLGPGRVQRQGRYGSFYRLPGAKTRSRGLAQRLEDKCGLFLLFKNK